jgi:hypothetical protein
MPFMAFAVRPGSGECGTQGAYGFRASSRSHPSRDHDVHEHKAQLGRILNDLNGATPIGFNGKGAKVVSVTGNTARSLPKVFESVVFF